MNEEYLLLARLLMIRIDLHLFEISKEQFYRCGVVRIWCTNDEVGAYLSKHASGSNTGVISGTVEDQNGLISPVRVLFGKNDCQSVKK